MGKIEASNKVHKQHAKPYRKTVLGSHNLAVFFKPSHGDFVSKQQDCVVQQLQMNGEEISAFSLFEHLKTVNKVMVKGTKLYESLKELHLAGWILPYTLILSGPSEDLKVVRHAWAKRNLKSPRGYFIKELGIVQDCVVQLITQSPFMSLTTALFDGVADLNHHHIFPTKTDLHEYLKKHYQEIKTPDMKTIHECLGKLIKERHLYHNGRGYFILQSENVLNEIIATKTEEGGDLELGYVEGNKHLDESLDSQALTPFLKGFSNAASSSVTNSSSPGQTDLDGHHTEKSSILIKTDDHDTSFSVTPNVMKKMFKRGTPKVDKKTEQKASKSKVFSCGIGGTMTDSITILSNAPVSECQLDTFTSTTRANKVALETSISSSDGDGSHHKQLDDQSDIAVAESEGRKITRSKSFSESDSNKYKEVSFALVGSPNTADYRGENGVNTKENYFKKSYSFGVGYSKKKLHKRPNSRTKRENIEKSTNITMPRSDEKTTYDSIEIEDEQLKYLDVETSFVEDSLPHISSEDNHLIHQPDMIPVVQKVDAETQHELLSKYKDLGSEISLHNKGVPLPLKLSDLLAPPKEDSLAQELKEAYNIKTALNLDGSTNSLTNVDKALLSPRSRRRFSGVPYESHYVEDILDGDTAKDRNMNVVKGQAIHLEDRTNGNTMEQGKATDRRNKSDKVTTSNKNKTAVKLRPKSLKSAEERKRDQKERNSLLFEEKRASLKVMEASLQRCSSKYLFGKYVTNL